MNKKLCFMPALMVLALTIVLASGGQVSSAFGQDLILHQTTMSPGMRGGAARSITSTHYLSSKAMKIVSSDGHDSIIQFDSGKIITIDNKQKTYTEMTLEQLNQMLSKQTADMGMDKKQLEQMRKMMGGTSDSPSVTKVGAGETIAGYATEKYLVKGPMEMEIHAAPDLKIPTLYYDAMKMTMQRSPLFDMGKLYDEMKKIKGYALKTVTTTRMMNMEIQTTTVVTSIEKRPIPASTFEVPAGYKLIR